LYVAEGASGSPLIVMDGGVTSAAGIEVALAGKRAKTSPLPFR
jgi:hypothetical protein